MSTAITLNLVPTQAVVYAAAVNTTNSSNTTTTTTTGAAASLNLSWKAGVAIGALVAAPFLMG